MIFFPQKPLLKGVSRGIRRSQTNQGIIINGLSVALIGLLSALVFYRVIKSSFGHISENRMPIPFETKLAVVFPFTVRNHSLLIRSLANWADLGSPCTEASSGQIAIHILQNVEDPSFQSDAFLSRLLSLPLFTKYGSCFSHVTLLNARLTPAEDEYPAGPSNMFFALYRAEHLQSFRESYDSFFWVEWDVIPLKPLWVDCLVDEASTADFWIRGSMLKGAGLDAAVLAGTNNDWVPHINGNALYNIRDPDFTRFLEVTIEYEPPGHFWKPFDISIWRVLHAFPYSWRLYQRFRRKFQHSDFIAHYSFGMSDRHLRFARQSKEIYFVHGSPISAGKIMYDAKFQNSTSLFEVVWDDGVLPGDDISIMLRTHAADAPFAEVAIETAQKHMPNAKELVVVVPEEDETTFADWPERYNAVLHLEPNIFSTGRLQQKYSKLNADRYCKGRFIFHLDSDVIFFRKVLRRDLFWRGKPVLEYDYYSNLPINASFWQKGTSEAIGKDVAYDFSRSKEHLFPREIYAAARSHLRNRYHASVIDFLKTRIPTEMDFEKQSSNDKLLRRTFSDFNFIGAFLWHYQKDRISWSPFDGFLALTEDFPSPIIPPYTCQANSRLARDLDEISAHVEAMRRSSDHGNCHEVDCDTQRLEALREDINSQGILSITS